jgi:hypothetical protein
MDTNSSHSGHIRGRSNRDHIHGDHRSVSMKEHSTESCNQRRSLARNQGRRNGDHDHSQDRGQVTPATRSKYIYICQHCSMFIRERVSK